VRPVRRRNARSELSAAAVAKSMKSSRRENHARAHPTIAKKSRSSRSCLGQPSRVSSFVSVNPSGQKSHDFVFTSSAEIKTLSLDKARRAQRGAQRTTC
jgi:hypothetical protein